MHSCRSCDSYPVSWYAKFCTHCGTSYRHPFGSIAFILRRMATVVFFALVFTYIFYEPTLLNILSDFVQDITDRFAR
jgi:hypothetical protein